MHERKTEKDILNDSRVQQIVAKEFSDSPFLLNSFSGGHQIERER